MATDFERDEAWIHGIFQALRSETVATTEAFTHRVLARVEELPAYLRGPRPVEVAADVVVEVVNLLTRTLGISPEEVDDVSE